MGYIRKAYREKLQKIDSRYNDLPKKWNKFIDEIRIKHNLIIKRAKSQSVCTNCKHEFVTNKKIGEFEKCPNCKNRYRVRSNRLKRYWFIDSLVLLDKVDNDLVFRYFEIWSAYDNQNSYYGFKNSVVEYGRSFFKKRIEVVNDRVSKCQCYIHVNHYQNHGTWREYRRHYSFGKEGYVYPYNLKEILKDTDYKYFRFEKFLKEIGTINFERVLENSLWYPSFEMLLKLKLYNLALDANQFNNTGSFNQIFGVPKDYYSFLKRNKIDYKQLEILRLLQEKDINKIRYLSQYSIHTLENIKNYISLDSFIKYAKMHRGKIDTYLYKDYLKFAFLAGLDLKNKKYIFPDNLKERHDELEKYVETNNRKLLNKQISKRCKELNNNKYQDEMFIILPAKSVEALENESKQQSNCVRTYSEDYANGSCDIYFMRLLCAKNKSLVTVEVKNNEVVQSRIKHNYQPTEEQKLFLEKWQQNVLQNCRV